MNDKTTQLPSKPMDYEVIGLTHARYGGRDFYGEHASDMAELAYLRDWKRWGESKFRTLMRNHSADIAQYERTAPETAASLTPIEQLLVQWWGSEMDNGELFNRAVRLSEPLAKAMMELPERAAQETRDDDPARWLLRWLNNRGGLGLEKHGLIEAVIEGRAYVRNDQLYTDGPTPTVGLRDIRET